MRRDFRPDRSINVCMSVHTYFYISYICTHMFLLLTLAGAAACCLPAASVITYRQMQQCITYVAHFWAPASCRAVTLPMPVCVSVCVPVCALACALLCMCVSMSVPKGKWHQWRLAGCSVAVAVATDADVSANVDCSCNCSMFTFCLHSSLASVSLRFPLFLLACLQFPAFYARA